MFTALEFFAGSGLVREGLQPAFRTLWANDNCAKKRATYVANHGFEEFYLGDIQGISGADLPKADLAWASFPCQDLSLAGNLGGIETGTRSGLFWEWVRILGEMRDHNKLPPLLVAENVVGFIVAEQGRHFRQAYEALTGLGYRVGALVIDAKEFVPQSRPRAFIVAVKSAVPLDSLIQHLPSGPFHSEGLIRTAFLIDDPNWVWWKIASPSEMPAAFRDLCERDAPCDPPEKTKKLWGLLSPVNRKKLDAAIELKTFFAGTAYKRTRPDECGKKTQRLEIRFDGVAGCLRTPNGGSSRQTVIFVEKGKVKSRLMTPRECARLMGAPDSYKLCGTYNDRYRAMGDAVAVPVTQWLTEQLLVPLAHRMNTPGPPVRTIGRSETFWKEPEVAVNTKGSEVHG